VESKALIDLIDSGPKKKHPEMLKASTSEPSVERTDRSDTAVRFEDLELNLRTGELRRGRAACQSRGRLW